MENEDLINYKNLLKPLEDLYQDLKADFFNYDSSAAESYRSRYLDDFEPLESPEIGLISDTVFKARNKLDGHDYTIERITLPDEKNDRIEILGMVKVLARNDHRRLVNFIRYNQAWLECPPSRWQEKKYKNWANKARGDSESARPTETDENRRLSILNDYSLSEGGSFYEQLSFSNDSSLSSFNKSPDMETSTSGRPQVYLYVQMQLLKDLKSGSSKFLQLRKELRSHLKLTSKNLKKSYKSSNGFYSNRAELRNNQDLENNLIEKNETDSSASEYYRSRYLDDFQEIEKLGSGGFGGVFKAKNKFDNRLYAIKRILLSHRQGVRKRDLREVKALAQFNNNNIVRYYQTWLESVPSELGQKWERQQSSSDESPNTDTSTHQQSSSEKAAVSYKTETKTETDDNSFSNAFINLDLSKEVTNDPSASLNNSETSQTNGDGLSFIIFESSHASHPVVSKEYNSTIFSKSSSSSNFDASASGDEKSSENQLYHYLFIQMELCYPASLEKWLEKSSSQTSKRRPNLRRLLDMFRQIVAAVHYIHSRGLIHRDLKPANIFFSLTSGRIKVGDFGLVTQKKKDGDFIYTQKIGTELYQSPEQVLEKPYTNKVDIYALGVTFFELLTPFGTTTERIATLKNLRNNIFPPDFESIWPKEIVQLTKSMLALNPEMRPQAAEIKSHIVELKKM